MGIKGPMDAGQVEQHSFYKALGKNQGTLKAKVVSSK
jgi:hypothetical protein